jgi:hypothetical protein
MSELKLVGIEHPVGNFKLDILCTDGEEQVVIENQLEESNHKHLGPILAYAAGVAPARSTGSRNLSGQSNPTTGHEPAENRPPPLPVRRPQNSSSSNSGLPWWNG